MKVISKNITINIFPIIMLFVSSSVVIFWAYTFYQAKYGMHGFGGFGLAMISSYALIASLCLLAILLLLTISSELINKKSNIYILSCFICAIPFSYLLITD